MGSRYRGTVLVDVEVNEVLEEIETQDLLDELKERGKHDDEANIAMCRLHAMTGLSAWDWENLVQAVKEDDGRRALDLLRPIVINPTRLATPEALSALARDPVNGRPVIQ